MSGSFFLVKGVGTQIRIQSNPETREKSVLARKVFSELRARMLSPVI